MNKRPIGITILAMLSLISGVGMLIIQIAYARELPEAMSALGVSSAALIANMMILATWAIVAGVGMWKGKRWGWWLGALYLSYSVLRNANAILTISDLVAQNPDQNIDAAKYYIKHTGRVLIHSLIVLYFFKNRVLGFFDLNTKTKLKRFLKFLGATVMVSIVMVFISMV